MMAYALDGSRLRELGWVPPLSLDESIKITVDWHKKEFGHTLNR